VYKSFKDMEIWQKAMDVAADIFLITETLPHKEDYGLTSQIRRSSVSISANIAEGFGREHTLDKINFYLYSRGSVFETQSHLEYGKRVKYFNEDIVNILDKKLSDLILSLNKLIKTLRENK